MAAAGPKEQGLMEQLTPFERRFVLKQRAMEVLASFAFPFRERFSITCATTCNHLQPPAPPLSGESS